MQGTNNCSTEKGKQTNNKKQAKKPHEKATTEICLGLVTVHTGKGGREGRSESSSSDTRSNTRVGQQRGCTSPF